MVVVGGVYVQDWERTGVPVQPDGDDAVTVRVCVPLEEHVPHAEYEYVHVGAT